MIASRLGVPVVPVRLEGLDRILHTHATFPDRGRGRVRVRRAYLVDRATTTRRWPTQVEAAVRRCKLTETVAQ